MSFAIHEMYSKTHADVGKRWDEKSGSIVNLQGRLPAKTYQKDTNSVSSGSKRKQKNYFDFQTLRKHYLWSYHERKNLLIQQM
jgi:hypothetical protein